MTERVLFLDIDGPMIPSRAYLLPNQTKPIVKVFDPVAVGLLNDAVAKQDRKIVIHSAWRHYPNNYGGDLVAYCISQGIVADHFHSDDPLCNPQYHYRYDRVDEWISRHPEVRDFMVLDDEPPSYGWKYSSHWIPVDFEDGLTWRVYNQIRDGTRNMS